MTPGDLHTLTDLGAWLQRYWLVVLVGLITLYFIDRGGPDASV